jgi:hypothetical protein
VGHQRQLMGSVELDEGARCRIFLLRACPAIVGKYPVDKALAQVRIVQAAFFLQGEQGKAFHHLTGKDAGQYQQVVRVRPA